jgi:hypothetical protein
MFSPEIVASDAFLDMPISTQALYFHLGMYADDDGFVQPQKTMRIVGASGDDLKVLLSKRFLLSFETGVVVIKHWLIHNMIRKDRYKETVYLDERKTLEIKDNGSYTEIEKSWQPNGNQLAPQVRLGKVRLGKVSKTGADARVKTTFNPLGAEIIKLMEKIDPKNKTYYSNKTQRGACDFLLEEYGMEECAKRISVLEKTNKLPHFPVITSPNDLKEKWVKLQDAVDRKRSEAKSKEPNVIM